MHIDSFRIAVNDLDVKQAVKRVLERIEERHTVNEESSFYIQLVMNELLNNIVEHSEATEVEISSDLDQCTVQLTITDNGKGFRYADLMREDVADGEGLMQESGRGVFIVRTIADSLSYNDAGNSVKVSLNCPG